MATLHSYSSLDSVPHVKSSNGFIQVMKFNSSSDEEENDYDDNEEKNPSRNKDVQKSLLKEQWENKESKVADLYAVVDKSKTQQGKVKSTRKKLEMEAEIFRASVSLLLNSFLFY